MGPGTDAVAGARLQVDVSDAQGRPLRGGLGRWLAAVAPARVRGQVSVAVVSDARIRALNRRFRGQDRATDVLSFPAGGSPAIELVTSSRARPRAPQFLGDIVIARGVAQRQAARAGHPESTEMRVLALHGLLHLLGYDHESDRGHMARLEKRLRRKGGLREGLIERR